MKHNAQQQLKVGCDSFWWTQFREESCHREAGTFLPEEWGSRGVLMCVCEPCVLSLSLLLSLVILLFLCRLQILPQRAILFLTLSLCTFPWQERWALSPATLKYRRWSKENFTSQMRSREAPSMLSLTIMIEPLTQIWLVSLLQVSVQGGNWAMPWWGRDREKRALKCCQGWSTLLFSRTGCWVTLVTQMEGRIRFGIFWS